MRDHFDQYLNVKELMLSHPPAHILELGALNAENTVQLMSLREEIPGLRLTVVTDGNLNEQKPVDPYLTWIWGISYIEMKKMPDKSFGCIVIDTDHNYWTLKQELNECARLLVAPGWMLMHDTVTYGKVTGKYGYAHTHATSLKHYLCGEAYPIDKIEAEEVKGLGMLDAIREFFEEQAGAFVLHRESLDEHGAIALRMKP